MRTLIYVAPVLVSLATGLSAAPSTDLAMKKEEVRAKVESMNQDIEKLQAGFNFFGDLETLVKSVTNAKANIDSGSKTVETDIPTAFTGNQTTLQNLQTAYNNFVTFCKTPANKDICDYANAGVKAALDNLGAKIGILAQTYNADFTPDLANKSVKSIQSVATTMDGMDQGDITQLQTLEGDINTFNTNVSVVHAAKIELDNALANQ